jgi:PAS domain S-box-containing protein
MAANDSKSQSTARQLRLLIESVTDYAIYMLSNDGFVTTWNAGAERNTGYTAAEALGRHFSTLFVPEDRNAGVPARALEGARANGHFELEGWRARKDGSRFWALTVIEAVRDETGQLVGFAEITRDITERYQAQQAFMESERRFRMLVQGVIDYAMYMLDPSGIIVNWNQGGQRIKGYTAEEVLGQHFSKFYTDGDRAAGLPFRALETARREGRFEGEGWRVRKDGSRFWGSVVIDAIHDENGRLVGFAKITRDITERLVAQQALRDSERQFRMLVASVTDYALFMLDPNGIVSSWNAGAQNIKGYLPHEIIGQHFSRFYTEQDRAAGMPTRSLFVATRDGRFEAEGWRVRKDGTLFWANVVIDAIRDDDGKLVGFAKITRDITERRQAQQALQQAQEQLAHAQKMEALGQLTGGVAHDFNNLLMIVSGQAQILKRRVAANADAVRAVEAIELAAQRGASLTRRLLAFSRRQHLRPEAINVRELGESLRTLLSSSLSRDVNLTLLLGEATWPVRADSGELELTLVNLALNARDAMPQGGGITVLAENVDLHRGERGVDLEGPFVALTVSDNGTGIPEDLLPKVFDPFFTTKPVDKGTGLGLSQVYGFAHQSGGSVSIESKVGQGTRVTLFLPRADHEPVHADRREEIAAPGSARILVVEDNPDVAPVTAAMLEELGHRTKVVHSAEAALQALAQDSNFDLVFSDVVMAGTDGIVLAGILKERYPALPVLLTTGYSRTADPAQLHWPLLRKPLQLAELNRAISNLLAGPIVSSNNPKLVRLNAARRSQAPPA